MTPSTALGDHVDHHAPRHKGKGTKVMPHTMQQAWAVLNETRRILERSNKPVAARARAEASRKPATRSKQTTWPEAVATLVAKAGMTRAAAARAIERMPGGREMRLAFIDQVNGRGRSR